MLDPKLNLVKKFQDQLQEGGLIDQTFVATMENALGENFITAENSIKNFTQHKSKVNVELASQALESYRSKLINSAMVCFDNTEYIEKAEILSDNLYNFRVNINRYIQAMLTTNEMSRVIVGYNDIFANIDNNLGAVTFKSEVGVAKAKDVDYLVYVKTFVSKMHEDSVKRCYSLNLYEVLKERLSDMNPEIGMDIVNKKYQAVQAILDSLNGDNFDPLIDNNSESLNFLTGKDHNVTLEELCELFSSENPNNILDRVDETLKDIKTRNFAKLIALSNGIDKGLVFKREEIPFPYLQIFIILFGGI